MSGREARVLAQAKINLFLHVLAREDTGYHQIETLFQRLELGDDVRVRVTERGRSLDCRGADVGPAESNIAYRAAELYAQAAEWPRGYAIEIDKRVPVGGGLGGGSADAAAVLRALNALNADPLPGPDLLALAGLLGSDVPFLAGEAALALGWGRGDRMLALPPLPPRDVLLVVPPFGVATGEAYRWLAEWRQRHGAPRGPRQLAADDVSSWPRVHALADNAFSSPVYERHRELLGIQAQLELNAGATFASMTGSGSTIFAIYDARPDVASVERLVTGTLLLTRTATGVADVEVTG